MGKVIAITGAGDGLGRALARRFARDGETVILLGRTLAKVQAVADEIGAPHRAIECDVAQPDSVRAAFAEIARTHPKIDVLINNAGIFQPFDVGEVTDEQVYSLIHTNLAGPIFCVREALPLLRGGGHVINVSSEAADIEMPMLWLYAGTKAALEQVSLQWSRDLAAEGVRVSVIQAGMMFDETKTASGWPPQLSMRFAQANAAVGIDLRASPRSHYDTVTAAFRSVIDSPPDLHFATIKLRARHPSQKAS
ncbi:MAG: SDR family oxidoreductase [Novosphingobium sp.]|nr:SDR family oxidoreductase [Novosphingobium sp.]